MATGRRRPAWAWHSPRVGGRLAPSIKAEAPYQGAGAGRRARGWFAPQLTANEATLGTARTLRNRARAGVRNDGYARSAVDRLVSNMIGSGMTPESKAPDKAFRDQVHALWLDWTDEADADNVLEFYGLQALAARAWLEGGEGFARLRLRLPSDGLTVPLQLQLLEPELVPIEYSVASGPRRIRAAIELDALNRRIAYWMYRARPAEGLDIDTSQLVRVPAEMVIHLFDPLRPGQLRGLTSLTQALIRLYEILGYDDATVARVKTSAMLAGFITSPAGLTPDGVNPMTGEALEHDEAGQAIMPLEPALLQELRPGEAITFTDPPDAPGYGEFMRSALMGASVAADVPYEVLTGDLRNVNDRTVRVLLNEFRRRIEQRQHHIFAFQFNRRVWEAWLDRAFASGALAIPTGYTEDPRPWRRVEWVAAAWPYLNPTQDIAARKAAIRGGMDTLTSVVKEMTGRNFADVAAERRRELDLLAELDIVTDTDPSKVSDAGLTQARPEGTTLPDVTDAAIRKVDPRPPPVVHVEAPAVHVSIDGLEALARTRTVTKTPIRDANGVITSVVEVEAVPAAAE